MECDKNGCDGIGCDVVMESDVIEWDEKGCDGIQWDGAEMGWDGM